MGISTKIEWCDSTVNAQMGCDGCELWNKRTGEGTCYAASLTERYAGRNGWPASFGEPKLFPERIEKACDWPDLTGTDRPEKPWLNDYPRMIFLDDMGDTWTESLPLDWLAPYVPMMAASPHIYMVLTKRARRMRRFWEGYGEVPDNFWLMVSVTSEANLNRVDELLKIPCQTKLVSYEPMLDEVDFTAGPGGRTRIGAGQRRGVWGPHPTPAECPTFYDGCNCQVDGIIFGGESGPGARPTDISVIRRGIAACREAGVAPFVKQLGPNPYETMESFEQLGTDGALANLGATGKAGHHVPGWTLTHTPDGKSRYYRHLNLRDSKGGDMSEWPAWLRVRELPPFARRQRELFG